MKQLQIIIPVREGGDAYTTISSLGRQTFTDFDIVVSQDQWGNANRARNEGLKLAAPSKYVLFSDDDIDWEPDGIRMLVDALERDSKLDYSYGLSTGYAYGSYEMGGKIYCTEPFSFDRLRRRNLASTMSVINRGIFTGFDESIGRLQDYDLWLTMAARQQVGVYCGSLVFRTAVRKDGITYGGKVSYEEAFQELRRKHGI